MELIPAGATLLCFMWLIENRIINFLFIKCALSVYIFEGRKGDEEKRLVKSVRYPCFGGQHK